jgi:hypothetical protein
MAGGSGIQTMVFSSAADSATFTGVFGGGFISLGSGNDNITFSGAAINGTTINGAENSDTIHFVAGNTSAVFGSAIGTAAQVSFGSGADMASFNGAISAGSIYGGAGADSLDFNTGNIGAATIDLGVGNDFISFTNASLDGAKFAGGAGTDSFSGSVYVGVSGVSFFGDAGNDTFNFGSGAITGTNNGGTAYFWNNSDVDSIVLSNITSATGAGVFFGITSGASLAISFAAAAASATSTFGAGTMSSTWTVHNNLVSFGFGSTQVTMVFVGGGGATIQGGVFETAAGTNIFSNALASTGTGNFGIAGSIPSFS